MPDIPFGIFLLIVVGAVGAAICNLVWSLRLRERERWLADIIAGIKEQRQP